MKKALSLILAALLLLSLTAALAQDYTLEEKLKLQLLNGSGLTGTAELSMENASGMSALDAAGNLLLRALVPGSTLELRYIRGINTNLGQEDLSLALSRAGAPLADLRYTTDGTLEALSSSLLGSSRFASNKGDGLIAGLFTGKEAAAWPGLDRAVMALSLADNAWNSRAEAALKPYTDQLSQWLQQYTQITARQDAGRQLTVNTITIPAAALKAEVKQLLSQAYQDNELLTLLRGQFTPREVAAYLQPSMLPALSEGIDRLPLAGEVVITRAYDITGAVAVDQLTLPMGGANGVKELSYRFEAAQDQKSKTEIRLEMVPSLQSGSQGAVHELSFTGGQLPDAEEGSEQRSYTGRLSLTTEGAASEGFTVDKPERQTRACDFTLSINHGKQQKDLNTGISRRAYEIGLLIRPVDQPTLGEQTIVIKGDLESGAQTNAATRFTGSLTWTDQLTGGSLGAKLTASSAAPWPVPTIAGTGAIRLDGMSSQQLAAQRAQVETLLMSAVAAFTRSLLPTAAP